MNLTEYSGYDGVGLADLIRKKEVTAQEVAESMREGVHRINSSINAIIEIYHDRVEKADQLLPPDKPLAGVPIFLKDLGAGEAGKLQEMGSRLAKGYIVETDAYLTTRFREAGAIILGRTTTPELGFAATTESVLTGATHNPWDLDLIAGGSSGGSAAAVAAGMVPVAHASDGGGSIRIPAACCGVVGLKPSRGRVSCGPEADERLFGLVQEFVVSRSVRDTAAMLDAVSKPAPGDPFVIVIRARAALNMTRRKVGAFFEKYDLLLTPTTAQLPVPLETIHQNQDIPIEDWYWGTSQFNAFTSLFNATGLPAISLPLCQSSTGLPVGIQFVAGFGKEDLLIRVASAFEEVLPWSDHKPPVHVGTL